MNRLWKLLLRPGKFTIKRRWMQKADFEAADEGRKTHDFVLYFRCFVLKIKENGGDSNE